MQTDRGRAALFTRDVRLRCSLQVLCTKGQKSLRLGLALIQGLTASETRPSDLALSLMRDAESEGCKEAFNIRIRTLLKVQTLELDHLFTTPFKVLGSVEFFKI